MGKRLDLQKLLKALPGVQMVAFQAPENYKLVYPAIVYSHSTTAKVHANNNPYQMERGYQLTVMDEDPDSLLFDAVEMLPKCTLDRVFAVGELNHKVYTIYF